MSVIALDKLLKKIDKNNIPKHIAIIMDGNGRWAKKIGRERAIGHSSGVKSVRDVLEGCIELNIKNLTLYVFSIENWQRPKIEVNALMHLLFKSITHELDNLIKNNVRLKIIGNDRMLPTKIKQKLIDAVSKTKFNTGLILNLAVSYGSKQEIIQAVKNISNKVKKNIISLEKIDENTINDHLYTRDLDNVDLLIRTGGEIRVSNFLLWQISYAELYFLKILWPDFRKSHLFKSVIEFQKRTRRFGNL
mgnify:FL=1|tara:strand:+ start:11348 stop:12091 length:744 start_codon:yes stop_codon:yes gene_type:complete